MKLSSLGYNHYFEDQFSRYQDKTYKPARVIGQHKGQYTLRLENGDYAAKLSGKYIYKADIKKDYPTVGDWVACQPINEREAVIHALLPRKTYFSRKLAISGGRKMKNGILVGGNIEEQVIGANIDTALIMSGLDENFNIGRMERFITLVLSSGARPIILLNKCDLCDTPEIYVNQIKAIAENIDVHFISVLNQINLEVLTPYLGHGQTIVALGSSGVGKSTLINHLFGGNILKTNTVSAANGKGRHTTTSPQLLQHPSGFCVIDTPGIRELQLWADEAVLEESFADVHALLAQCHFSDCSHTVEKGCAIRAALQEGRLSPQRYHRFQQQSRELSNLKANRKSYDCRRLNRLKSSKNI